MMAFLSVLLQASAELFGRMQDPHQVLKAERLLYKSPAHHWLAVLYRLAALMGGPSYPEPSSSFLLKKAEAQV